MDAYQLPTGTISVREPHTAATGVALYARVSSAAPQDDALPPLQRRRDYAAAPGYPVVAEVIERASGWHDARPNLTKLRTERRVGVLVVEQRDRLTRFGYGSIAPLRARQGRRVAAHYPSDTPDGWVEDVVAVLPSRAARIYGRRNSKRRAKRIRACVEHVLLHSASEDA